MKESRENNSTPSNNRLKAPEWVVLPLASALATAAVLGIINHVKPLTREGPKPSQEVTAQVLAMQDVRGLYGSLTTKDVLNCEMTSVELGPEVVLYSRKSPSVLFNVHLKPGDEDGNEWLYGGKKVNDYQARIDWMSPHPTATHEINDRTLPGRAWFINSKNNSVANLPEGAIGIDGSELSETGAEGQIAVGVNPRYVGERTVKLKFQATGAHIVSNGSDNLAPDDPKKFKDLEPVHCGEVRIRVNEDGTITLLDTENDTQASSAEAPE